MMQLILAGALAFGVLEGWAQACGVKEYWTENCTACPGNWYANCGAYKRVGERGCGFLNAGCQLQCRKDFGPCPVDCAVSDWGEWSSCTEQCWKGGLAIARGTMTRTRTVTQTKKGKGKGCPDLEETKKCDPVLCKPSKAGDLCKSREWYVQLCAITKDSTTCKKRGCNWKKEECIPHKKSKKIKCKKLNNGVYADESICSCFKIKGQDKDSGCKFNWKTKGRKKVKKRCIGTHKWLDPEE